MKKKTYEAPVVQKIKLSIGEAILGTCHSSPNTTPITNGIGCEHFPDSCWTPPIIVDSSY